MKQKMVVTERTMPEVGLLIMLLVILFGLTRCSGGKFCMSLNAIDEVKEEQKLSRGAETPKVSRQTE